MQKPPISNLTQRDALAAARQTGIDFKIILPRPTFGFIALCNPSGGGDCFVIVCKTMFEIGMESGYNVPFPHRVCNYLQERYDLESFV
jgi:hypothetical protein